MLADRIKKLKFGGNNTLPVFIICVLIAAVFWILNSLNKEYSYSFAFPLEVINMPYSKRMVNTAPDSIKVLCKARGFELFWFSIRNARKKINIDLDEKKIASADKISIGIKSEFIGKFKNDLQQMEIVSAQPDSIHLFLSARYLKKVPVISNLKYTLKTRFGIAGSIKIEPDSILISGDKADIANVNAIETEEKELALISTTTLAELNLIKPENVFLSANKINISIPVEEYTEGKVIVPLNISMINGLKVYVLPAEAEITYQATFNNYSKIEKDSFRISAQQVTVGKSKKLKLTVAKSPVNAKVISIIPPFVDYYFEK